MKSKNSLLWGVFIFFAVLLAFFPVLSNDFINMDDDFFIYRNPYVRGGLTWHGLAWAFTADLVVDSANADYWQPVTVISRMVDFSLFGANPHAHHAVSLLIHALSACLLFYWLARTLGHRLKSFIVTMIFAVHPLQTEAVAWATARKDLLAVFFILISLWFYQKNRKGAFAAFLLSLMAKPAFILYPFFLVLMDYSLLRKKISWKQSVVEKWPFWVGSGLALLVQIRSHWLSLSGNFEQVKPLQSFYHFFEYLGKFVKPWPMVIYYPLTSHDEITLFVSAIFFGVLLYAFWTIRKGFPEGWFGWMWCVLFILPGLAFSIVDRRLYFPIVGLAIVIVWGLDRLFKPFWLKRFSMVLAGVLLIVWGYASNAQARLWKDSETIFTHAVQNTYQNVKALNNLASAHLEKKDYDRALSLYLQAIQQEPNYTEAYNNAGVVCMRRLDYQRATGFFELAYKINPKDSSLLSNWGAALWGMGRYAEAAQKYEEALKINPDYVDVRINYGNAYYKMGRIDDAIAQYEHVIKINSQAYEALNNLGVMLMSAGRLPEAEKAFLRSLEASPYFHLANNNYSHLLVKLQRYDEAIEQAKKAISIDPEYAEAYFNLGNAFLKKGDKEKAILNFEKAHSLNPAFPIPTL